MRIVLGSLALSLLLLVAGCVSPQVKLGVDDILRESQPPGGDKTIALIGATGMVGGYILQRAVEAGYPVKVLARTPEKLEGLASRIDIVQGDARDPKAIERLIEGSDIVITALGPVKADGAAANMITTTATGHVIKAMEDSGVRPYIVVSGAAVVVPGDDRNLSGWWMRQLVKIRLPGVLADRQAEYELLAASDVDWTLVRCPLIDSAPYENTPEVSLVTPSSFHLRAGELAEFIIREAGAPSFSREAPFLYSE